MTDTATHTLGFVGLGLMGLPMCRHLVLAGHRVSVHDRRREAAGELESLGAVWADTPRAVAEQSAAVFTCLPGEREIEAVATGPDGLLDGIAPGAAWFDLSTNSPALVARLAAAFARRGAHMLDAPVSGGPTGAARRELAVWVGGEETVFRRHETVLRAMADHPMRVGATGAGTVTKLVHNCAAEAMQAALAEAFVLGVKAGAEPLSLFAAIRHGAVGRRRSFDGLIDQFLPGRYDAPQAMQQGTYKDILIATGLGRDLKVPLRFAELAFADITEAMNRGWAERDCRAVMLLPQERAGVSVAIDPARIAAVLEADPAAPTDTRHGAGARAARFRTDERKETTA